jgi:FMN reductase
LPTLLAIHGTVTRPGRLYQALELAVDHANAQLAGKLGTVSASLLHLGDNRISFADGRPLADYPDDTEAVVRRVMEADMCLIATQVFRASFTGALKNLLDHVPVEGLMGKACGLVAMGATDHHYLTVDTQLRPVLAWFGAHVMPGMVYLQSSHFQDGKLTDERSLSDLRSLVSSVISLHEAAAEGGLGGPPPLASR